MPNSSKYRAPATYEDLVKGVKEAVNGIKLKAHQKARVEAALEAVQVRLLCYGLIPDMPQMAIYGKLLEKEKNAMATFENDKTQFETIDFRRKALLAADIGTGLLGGIMLLSLSSGFSSAAVSLRRSLTTNATEIKVWDNTESAATISSLSGWLLALYLLIRLVLYHFLIEYQQVESDYLDKVTQHFESFSKDTIDYLNTFKERLGEEDKSTLERIDLLQAELIGLRYQIEHKRDTCNVSLEGIAPIPSTVPIRDSNAQTLENIEEHLINEKQKLQEYKRNLERHIEAEEEEIDEEAPLDIEQGANDIVLPNTSTNPIPSTLSSSHLRHRS